jgi:glycosyltransferase involved in cell wall biosynthesis
MNSSKTSSNTAQRNSRKFRLISQYLVNHDAVSKHMLDVGSLLTQMGHSVVFHALGSNLKNAAEVQPVEAIQNADADEILFYQYSIWDPNFDLVRSAPQKKIAYYHGITTPALLAELMPHTAQDCQKGLDALPELSAFDYILANSEFDLNEIRQHFAPVHAQALPPYLSLPPLDLQKQAVDSFHLIYVGRFFPHKNIEKVLEVFLKLHALDLRYQLTLAGSGALPEYLEKLKKLANNHPRIHFQFDLPALQLAELYQSAGALLNFSKHEGFGVPFIEAFQYQVPVISHSYAAIAETLRGAGILLEDGYGEKEIETLHTRLQTQRSTLVQKQNEVFERYYRSEVVTQKYKEFFEKVTSA